MLAPADALRPPVERADEPRRRQVLARSVRDGGDVSESGTFETGPDVCPPYNHRGTIVVGSAWLAFYVIVAIDHLMASAHCVWFALPHR